MYFFETIPIGQVNIDEFNHFEQKSVFTTIPWIRFIAKDNNAIPIIIRISDNERFLGYFTGLVTTKFGIKIFGSPFRGWSTCFMGFDLSNRDNIINILPYLVDYIFKNTKCLYIEHVERGLDVEDIKSIPFKTRLVDTLELEIENRSDANLFSGFKGDCRTFINQFEKRGASIEEALPNDVFAQEYYDQLKDVFKKQSLVPTYTLEKVKTLLNTLAETGMLLCLRVNDPKGKCIATSIFLGFNNKFFFWGGASYSDAQAYRPNEYMIWYAIRYWRDRGVKIFDMVGVREYKLKFGSQKKEYVTIISAKYQFLIFMRDLAEKLFFAFLHYRGKKKDFESQRNGNLIIKKVINQELAHFNNETINIFSKFNKVKIEQDGLSELQIKLPVSISQRILGGHRLLRRLFRLDKSSILPTDTGYVAFWQGNVYHIAKESLQLTHTLKMIGCRNPLHNSIANIDGMNLYFGEYGQPHSQGKSIYRSLDGGLSWNKIYNISCDKIRHIHACKWDPFEERVWVFTGDFEGQSWIISADREFKDVEWIGDGTQYYRAVDAVFDKNAVHWIMDSPISEVHHIRLDRKNRTISIGQVFPGPVWYLKELADGITLACSVQEVGPSHKDDKVHLFASRNMKKWVEVAEFEHDGFKKGIMKFGVGAFADGAQSSKKFYIHFEAIKKYDGKVILCSLTGI